MNNIVNTSMTTNYQEQKLRNEILKQDVYRSFVLNANSIEPQEQKAYLLKSRNPISSTIIGIADTGRDIVELGKALVTGKSNDNQLGRFNDLGMKLGGLAIASYLFTRRGTGTKGVMEFLGAGAFFASMAIWPRLLISEPLKYRFGFDIRQQYVDAQGRKKRLYLDNQFVPDLYSDEQIDKIARKMGIDRSKPDYKELTKEKMRSIALQGNTLWMLSAGFSPLLTAMICNVAERAVTKYIVSSQYNRILNNVDDIEKIAQANVTNPAFAKDTLELMKHTLARHSGNPYRDFCNKIAVFLNPFETIMNNRDLDDANLIDELTNVGPEIRSRISNLHNSINEQSAAGVIEIKRIIPVIKKDLGFGADSLQSNKKFADFSKQIIDLLLGLKANDPKGGYISAEQLHQIFKNCAGELSDTYEINKLFSTYKKCLDYKVADSKTAENYANELLNIFYTQTRPISARVSAYSDFLNGLVGQKYESLHTSIHLNSLNKLISALQFSQKEFGAARNSVNVAANILKNRFERLVGNDDLYKKLISDLTTSQAEFESKTVEKLLDKIKKQITKGLYPIFENIPENSPLAVLKQEVGSTYSEAKRMPMYKRVIDMFIEEKGAGIRATGHRYILEADFERRLHTGELAQHWKYLTGQESIGEDVVRICRDIIYKGSMNDLANKFYQEGNGIKPISIIKLLFEQSDCLTTNGRPYGLAEATYSSCNKAMLQKLMDSRSNFYRIYAQLLDHARPGHMINNVGIDAAQKTQYSMLGKSGAELFMETASQKFNDKCWLKMFGITGLVVVGLVLVSQLFFGKVKNEHLYGKKENGGVDASK